MFVASVTISGQKRDVVWVSESGLYRLVLTSRKPQAEPFQDWVCQDVLPEIRKTGKYEVAPVPAPEISSKDFDLLRCGLSSLNTALVDGFVLNRIGFHKPHLLPDITEAHKLLAATTTIPDVLLTPTLIGKELGISAVKVNKLLVSTGYQIKNEKKSKGSPDYVPTELGKQYAELTMATGDGTDNTTYQHLKWDKRILDILGELV